MRSAENILTLFYYINSASFYSVLFIYCLFIILLSNDLYYSSELLNLWKKEQQINIWQIKDKHKIIKTKSKHKLSTEIESIQIW